MATTHTIVHMSTEDRIRDTSASANLNGLIGVRAAFGQGHETSVDVTIIGPQATIVELLSGMLAAAQAVEVGE